MQWPPWRRPPPPEASDKSEKVEAGEKLFRKKPLGVKFPDWMRVDWFMRKTLGRIIATPEMLEELKKKDQKFTPAKPAQRHAAHNEVDEFLKDFLNKK